MDVLCLGVERVVGEWFLLFEWHRGTGHRHRDRRYHRLLGIRSHGVAHHPIWGSSLQHCQNINLSPPYSFVLRA